MIKQQEAWKLILLVEKNGRNNEQLQQKLIMKKQESKFSTSSVVVGNGRINGGFRSRMDISLTNS